MCTETRIHQNRTLIRFHEEASYAIFYRREVGSHRATIEKTNGHKGICLFHLTKTCNQRRRDFTEVASPPQWKGLWRFGRKAAFFKTIQHKSVLEAEI